MSTLDYTLLQPLCRPFFRDTGTTEVQSLIEALNFQPHPEGGYFVETDRNSLHIPNPFLETSTAPATNDDATRSASTTIYYLLTPHNSIGVFHRNKGRTIHTLHRGRGRYVIIHADEKGSGGKKRVETFVVGSNLRKGERLQWVVEGGKYKASFLLPDEDGEESGASGGLLISETVVPGFEFVDHDFLEEAAMKELVTLEQEEEIKWLVKKTTA